MERQKVKPPAVYCPYCGRDIEAEEEDGEPILTYEGGFIYVHDDLPHDDDFFWAGAGRH